MISLDSFHPKNTSKFMDFDDFRSVSAMETSRPKEFGDFSESFPTRKRSVPLGFDFDLDEVWAPQNSQLRGMYRNHLVKGMSCSESSLYTGPSLSRQPLGNNSKLNSSQDSLEFAVDNESIFQSTKDSRSNQRTEMSGPHMSQATASLPSTRTLRGGQALSVRGRHSSLELKNHRKSPFRELKNDHSRSRRANIHHQRE